MTSSVRTRGRLTQKEVKTIKWMLYNGASQPEVAERFKVSQGHISKIVHGKVHARIPWPDGTLGPSDVVRYMMEGELIPRPLQPVINPSKGHIPYVPMVDIDPMPAVSPDMQADASVLALDGLLDNQKLERGKKDEELIKLDKHLDSVVDEQLFTAVGDIGEEAGEPTMELSQKPVDHRSWAEVVGLFEEGHPLINWQEHLKGDDKLLYRECLGILFASMEESQWFSKVFYDNLIELASRRGLSLNELFANRLVENENK